MCRPLPKGREFCRVINYNKRNSQKRILRYKEGKSTPMFFNLYTKDTVEKNWVENKTIKGGFSPYTRWCNLAEIRSLA